MRKKKIFISIATLTAIIGINILTLLPKPAQAYPHWVCDGYHWKICLSGAWVIRCDCTGGPQCWAEWQELCD